MNKYPNIKVTEEKNYVEYETELHLFKNGKWYDIIIKDRYSVKSLEKFKDQIMRLYLFFQVNKNTKISKNQNKISYPDLEDINWQNRIKKQAL